MGKLYKAIFTEKKTGKVLFKLSSTNVLNKYFWEKEKVLALRKLIKDRFMEEREIVVTDEMSEK